VTDAKHDDAIHSGSFGIFEGIRCDILDVWIWFRRVNLSSKTFTAGSTNKQANKPANQFVGGVLPFMREPNVDGFAAVVSTSV
jgi:hypothetical protein